MTSYQNTRINPAQSPRPLNFRVDLILVLAVIALTAIGLITLYSASLTASLQAGNASYFFRRQVGWVALGIVVAVAASLFNYHFYKRYLLWMMAGTACLLIAVLVVGEARLGSVRSLLGGSVRPSELAKLAIIVYLAFWLASKQDVLNSFSFGLLPMIAIVGLMCGLVILQPDLSATITIFAMGVLLYFLAGGAIRQIVPIGIVSALVGWAVVMIYPVGRSRVLEYLAGLQNPVNAADQVVRSFEAIIRGGFFGVGIGRSVSRFLSLPLAHTDSIFAVIAEEMGLLGAIVLILLFVVLLWRGLRIAQKAPDMEGRLLAGGLAIWIFLEAAINMAVMVNVMPVAGNALPFISSGGSSITMTFLAVGILLNVNMISEREESVQGRSYRAVVDMRGRNSRRGVSRSVRSGNTR